MLRSCQAAAAIIAKLAATPALLQPSPLLLPPFIAKVVAPSDSKVVEAAAAAMPAGIVLPMCCPPLLPLLLCW